MTFSKLFKQSNQICEFSPDDIYLASTEECRLIVRDIKTLQKQYLFYCLATIQHIEWSANSEFVLCGLYKRGSVQVWSVKQPDWKCKIDEGSSGLCAARWSPDSRHILTTADSNLHMTVWSLVKETKKYIRYPKQCQQNIDFSSDERYMALVGRKHCQDFIRIFDCSSWKLLKTFESSTCDLSRLQWSPDSSVLCIWDTPRNYLALVYSVDGSFLLKVNAYDNALGLKTATWSPKGQFLALGSYDGKLRLLNRETLTTITTIFSHPDIVDDKSVVVHKEIETRTTQPATAPFSSQSKYEVQTCPVKITVIKPNKAYPKRGVGMAAFNFDCKYMFTRNDNMPHTLWIWDVQKLALCEVIIQSAPIKHVEWDPLKTRLALCTGVNKLYMWSPACCLCWKVQVEVAFQVHSLKWHPGGGSLLLLDKDMMCIRYLNDFDHAAEDYVE